MYYVTTIIIFIYSFRNYPTIANIIKKKQLETEKKNRRQVLNTPLYK